MATRSKILSALMPSSKAGLFCIPSSAKGLASANSTGTCVRVTRPMRTARICPTCPVNSPPVTLVSVALINSGAFFFAIRRSRRARLPMLR